MKSRVQSSLVVAFTFIFCGTRSFAQHSFQQHPWQKSPRHQRSQSDTQRAVPDSQSHFLDDEEWMTDKRVRSWDVQLKSRRPNRYSWTSQLILANVIMYGLQSMNPAVTQLGVKLSDRILRGEELYRLITPVFLHGSIFHLFSNMYSLNNVGVTCEQLFGSGRYLVSFMVAGAAGNLLSAVNSPNPALGASGAVFGVMASFYVFLSRHEWLLGNAGRSYSGAITQTLFINLAIGAMNPMVDNWGHLGGALGGAAMAYYFGPRLYLAETLDGGRIIVDRPILRLPRSIESIPEKISTRTTRMFRRMQIWRYTADLPEKPWRPKGGSSPKINYQRRMDAPNRSIKPKL
jgi:membrane associated rhomboid family serine protease